MGPDLRSLLLGACAAIALFVALWVGGQVEASDSSSSLLEEHDTQNMRWLRHNYPNLYNQLEELPWVEDGLSDLERDIIDGLLYVGGLSIPTLTALVPMPFLQGADSTDVLALRSVYSLAYLGTLVPLSAHPAFVDGITEDETVLIAAAGTLYRDAGELARILDPEYASVETATVATSTQFSIVRTGNQPHTSTLEALVDAAGFVERTMSLDLPVDHVVLVLNEKAVSGGTAGTNYGFAISYLPSYEQAPDTFEGRSLRQGLAHEVAHYYWRGNAGWVDEGLANTIEYMYGIEKGLSPGQLRTPRRTCEDHDLQMLSEESPHLGDPRFYCNYFLGTLLFQELREIIGEEEFNRKLTELFPVSLLMQRESIRPPGIEMLKRVFADHANILDKHWSGALNSPEKRPFDEGVHRISHHLIQWDQHPIFDEQQVQFRATLLGEAVLTSETVHQAREGGRFPNFSLNLADAYGYLGSILPTQSEGRRWILDDPGDAVATDYLLEERAFTATFTFPNGLTDDPHNYVVIVWGFRDELRTPTIGDDVDNLGYARIRVAMSTGSAIGDRYDADRDGVISRTEAIAAINDYLFGSETGEEISRSDILEIINFYLFG